VSSDPPSTPPGHVPPIRREILVDADPATAFAVFTERIGLWWPLEDLSVYGPGGTVGFADGQIVERSASGDAAVWGTVYLWEPAAALAFSWHPGGPPDQATHAEVTFTPADAQTLVTLTHTGWERFADPAEARAEYELGWPVVLGTYRDHVAHHEQDESSAGGGVPAEGSPAGGGTVGAAPDEGPFAGGGPEEDRVTWVALLHRPGPAAPAGAALFGARSWPPRTTAASRAASSPSRSARGRSCFRRAGSSAVRPPRACSPGPARSAAAGARRSR
jgi:hypothetical protein